MTIPRSTHAVARIVPKNPNWALDSTIAFLPAKSQQPAPAQQSANRREQAHFMNPRGEGPETD